MLLFGTKVVHGETPERVGKSQERQRETLKKNGSGTPVRNGVIPPTKVVRCSLCMVAKLILSVDIHATLPEREQRNYVYHRLFSTRLPGRHVENCRSPKRFSDSLLSYSISLSETARTLNSVFSLFIGNREVK